jgi:hypothetical protein
MVVGWVVHERGMEEDVVMIRCLSKYAILRFWRWQWSTEISAVIKMDLMQLFQRAHSLFDSGR